MYGYITWQSHDSHMITWQSPDSHLSNMSHMITTVTYSHLSHMTVTWQSHDSHMNHMTVTWPDTHLQISQGAVSLTIHTSILDNVIKSELQNREQHTRSQTSTPIVSPIERRREKCTIHLRTKPPLHGKPATHVQILYPNARLDHSRGG